MDENGLNLELPGFRFKPTEEELLSFYLKNVVYNKKMHLGIIGFLNIYQHAPWDLPGLAKNGEREWYFYVLRDIKHGGGRPNRTTKHGFWKATGSDRKIVSFSEPKRIIGLRKTLVFYEGRAPRGSKTDWVMNEYRLPDNCDLHKDIVLCKVYRKATSLKELEERAAKEEAMDKSTVIPHNISCPTSPLSSSNRTALLISDFVNDNARQRNDFSHPLLMSNNDYTMTLKKEDVEEYVTSNNYDYEVPVSSNSADKMFNLDMNPNEINSPVFMTPTTSKTTLDPDNINYSAFVTPITSKTNYGCNNIKLPFGKDSLGELQVPKLGLEWAQDPIFTQTFSPWLENLLNFSSPTLLSQILST